jgi:ABC-2 type transport system ATP-binding protein
VLAERVGVLDRGRLLALESPARLKERYGAETLEDAFFAATGRGFEDEEDEIDAEERKVLA